MKKWFIIMSLFLIMLLTISTLSFGANKLINVSVNGSSIRVLEVPVLMDGQAFKSEVPSFVYIDRTLVPVRFIAESLGAKVEWDQKTKTATVIQDKNTIKLTIDSPNVFINNERKALDNNSIPKLVTFSNNDSRTMVPVRLISEVLGYDVGWDQANRIASINTKNGNDEVIDLNPEIKPPVSKDLVTITDVTVQKGSTPNQKIVIKSDNKIEYETLFLPDSNKLVIDIKNSRLNRNGTKDIPGDITVKDINFSRVQFSQYSTNPYTTRIVVSMHEKLDYEIVPSRDGKTSVLSFVNKVNGINIENVNGQDALVIDGIGTSYNVMKLKNPERIVIDLLDATLGGVPFANYNYELGFVKGVRTSQFSGDNNYSPIDRIVRVVLDVNTGITDPNIKIETIDNKLVIYPERSFWENISYVSGGLDNKLLSIGNLQRTRYDVEYNPTENLMEITIPSNNVELDDGFVIVKDGLVEDIEVISDKDDTKVRIRFRIGIEYNILSSTRTETIEVSFRRDPKAIDTNKTIVIDAGHGGLDPGAISINGIREKDVNLQISLKLEKQLKSLGYNVLMTRSSDQNTGLYERTNFANGNNADIFVSIHANAHINRDIKGIQVLYCPLYDSKVKTTDQYPLAKSVFDALLSSTGAEDKGIIKRKDLVVVRETKMPAILVEVGFLSNVEEEKLIINDNYQNIIVEGIVSGIQNYFEMY